MPEGGLPPGLGEARCVISDTGTVVTVNSIVFSDGTIVGQAICGRSYPLAVSVAGEAAAPDLGSSVSSEGDGGPPTRLLALGGAFALAVLAQVVVGRKMWHRKGDATG